MEPELRISSGGWVAEREGIQVVSACGQEALLRLELELWRRHSDWAPGSRLIVEEAQVSSTATPSISSRYSGRASAATTSSVLAGSAAPRY